MRGAGRNLICGYRLDLAGFLLVESRWFCFWLLPDLRSNRERSERLPRESAVGAKRLRKQKTELLVPVSLKR